MPLLPDNSSLRRTSTHCAAGGRRMNVPGAVELEIEEMKRRVAPEAVLDAIEEIEAE